MQILVSCVLQQQKNIRCHIFNVTVAFEEEEMYQKLSSDESKENSIAQPSVAMPFEFSRFSGNPYTSGA